MRDWKVGDIFKIKEFTGYNEYYSVWKIVELGVIVGLNGYKSDMRIVDVFDDRSVISNSRSNLLNAGEYVSPEEYARMMLER